MSSSPVDNVYCIPGGRYRISLSSPLNFRVQIEGNCSAPTGVGSSVEQVMDLGENRGSSDDSDDKENHQGSSRNRTRIAQQIEALQSLIPNSTGVVILLPAVIGFFFSFFSFSEFPSL